MGILVKWILERPSIEVNFRDDERVLDEHDDAYLKLEEKFIKEGKITTYEDTISDDELSKTIKIEFNSIESFWEYEKTLFSLHIQEDSIHEFEYLAKHGIKKIKYYEFT